MLRSHFFLLSKLLVKKTYIQHNQRINYFGPMSKRDFYCEHAAIATTKPLLLMIFLYIQIVSVLTNIFALWFRCCNNAACPQSMSRLITGLQALSKLGTFN